MYVQQTTVVPLLVDPAVARANKICVHNVETARKTHKVGSTMYNETESGGISRGSAKKKRGTVCGGTIVAESAPSIINGERRNGCHVHICIPVAGPGLDETGCYAQQGVLYHGRLSMRQWRSCKQKEGVMPTTSVFFCSKVSQHVMVDGDTCNRTHCRIICTSLYLLAVVSPCRTRWSVQSRRDILRES